MNLKIVVCRTRGNCENGENFIIILHTAELTVYIANDKNIGIVGDKSSDVDVMT